MQAHADDLRQQLSLLESRPIIELVELRLKASGFEDGSIPLRLLAKIAEDFRQMLGYAALRLIRGGDDRKARRRSLAQQRLTEDACRSRDQDPPHGGRMVAWRWRTSSRTTWPGW